MSTKDKFVLFDLVKTYLIRYNQIKVRITLFISHDLMTILHLLGIGLLAIPSDAPWEHILDCIALL